MRWIKEMDGLWYRDLGIEWSSLSFFIVPVRGILRCGCTVVSSESFYAICCEEPGPIHPGRTIHSIIPLDVLASPLLRWWFEFCDCKIPYSKNLRYFI